MPLSPVVGEGQFSLLSMSIFRCGCAALAAALVLGAREGVAEVRIVDQGPSRLRVEYAADGPDRQQAGRSYLVGLPLEGEVQLEVVEAVRRVEEAAGRSSEKRPRGPVYLGEEGFIRDQRVVELVFAPRQEEDGRLVAYERVVADLRFTGAGETRGRRRRDRWGEEFLRQTLLNYDQARKWRRRRGAGKVVSLDDGLQAEGMILLRVQVREEGLYRVTGGDLEELGIGLRDVDPASLRLFYGGGRPLPLTIEEPPLARREIGLVVEDGGDGRFDEEDFVLFYGEPVSRWEYETEQGQHRYLHNLYTYENVYWLGVGGDVPRRELASRSGALREAAPQRPQSFRVRVHQESEQFVVAQTYTIKSGYDWYWEDFHGNARNFPALVRAAVDEPVDIRLRFLKLFNSQEGRALQPRFTVKWNEEEVGEIAYQSSLDFTGELQTARGPKEGLNQLGLFHDNAETARLDWYELEYSRGFAAERGELLFESPVAEGVAEFRLTGFAEERPRIFEVSEDLVEIRDLAYEAAAGPAGWKRPVRLEVDRKSSLKTAGQGAEYLVITHADFGAAAERLAGWRARDGRFGAPLRTMVVDVEDIYDEFSGGLLDPTAIRNFLHFAYEHWDPAPFFVVLLGDGTYDYKNNSGTSTGNWVLAYQDGDSTYDEWYVRAAGDDVLPDMAIGRLPVQTVAEADIVVDKVVEYDRQPEMGPWQSRVLLVADDLSNPDKSYEVETYFLIDAEDMAQNLLPEHLDLIKLYLAQFPLEGRTKPRARAEFIRRFNEGALILTFLGHGNPDVLAHERMFVVSRDLGEIDNGRRLPLFYTAASQVGVFDDPVRTSMPEALLKLPSGGVIGMISATRVGFHDSNMILADQFHWQMYRTERSHVPVGLALMEAKQMVPINGLDRRNIQRYSLFGDPATRLAVPRYQVEIQVPDSLRALGEVLIEGRVLDMAREPAADFDGRVWVQAFDSAVDTRLDGLFYRQIGVALFRGLFPVEGGGFSAAFRVPKDITYRGTNGRISAYAWGDGHPAAFGEVSGLVLAGTAAGVELDQEGPEIVIGFQGQESFTSGGEIPRHAVLRAVISDPSGINVTGETGHEIELTVDQEAIKVTEFFSVRGGDYREGILEYPLPALEPGVHEIRLKAWDSFNNSARAQVLVQASDRDEFALANVLFHPNPLRAGGGHFTYDLSVRARSVRIQVFSLGGKRVDEVEGETRLGFNQVAWNPAAGLANGAYLYRVQVESEDGREIARTAVIQVMK